MDQFILGQCVNVTRYIEVDWQNERLVIVHNDAYYPKCVIKQILGNTFIVQNIDTKEEYITSSNLVTLCDRRRKERRKQ